MLTFAAVATAILSVSCGATAAPVIIPLGSCDLFALQAGTALNFNGKLTTINTGNIGVAPGNVINGNYKVSSGTVENDSASAKQCTSDLQVAYSVLVAQPCDAANLRSEIAGQTLAPGVYCSATEMKFSAATVTLDGQGNPNAQFIFQVGTALTTASSTSFILENGAQEKNIYWALGTAATLGSSSSMVGNIIAQTAITFNYGSVITGRALAATGVSFESGSTVTLPATTTSTVITAIPASKERLLDNPLVPVPLPLALGGCQSFALLAGTSLNFNGGKTVVQTGSIGVSPGEVIGGSYVVVAGTEERNTPIAKSCAADLAGLYATASNAQCTGNQILQTSDLAGVVLTPGVYCSATGKFSLSAATVTLDAQGNPQAQWVFQTVTTLTTSTATSFNLINGARSENVFWAIGTSASLGYSSNFVGNILAKAAINYATSTNIVGRGLAMTAITFADQGVINIPTVFPVPTN